MKTGVWGQIPLTNSKVKKNGTHWTNSLDSRERPLSCGYGNVGNAGFLSHLPLLLWTQFLWSTGSFCILVWMSSFNSSNGFVYGALKNQFIAKMLIGVMSLIRLNLPVKIHQNLMSGFHFYTLHSSKWLKKLLDLHSRLRYNLLRCFLLHCWLPKRQYRCL